MRRGSCSANAVLGNIFNPGTALKLISCLKEYIRLKMWISALLFQQQIMCHCVHSDRLVVHHSHSNRYSQPRGPRAELQTPPPHCQYRVLSNGHQRLHGIIYQNGLHLMIFLGLKIESGYQARDRREVIVMAVSRRSANFLVCPCRCCLDGCCTDGIQARHQLGGFLQSLRRLCSKLLVRTALFTSQ